MLVDSHCHLDFPDFDGEQADLVARARAAGVTRMVTICTRMGNEPRVRAVAEETGYFEQRKRRRSAPVWSRLLRWPCCSGGEKR